MTTYAVLSPVTDGDVVRYRDKAIWVQCPSCGPQRPVVELFVGRGSRESWDESERTGDARAARKRNRLGLGSCKPRQESGLWHGCDALDSRRTVDVGERRTV